MAGRASELAALRGELARAAQGELRVAVVAGDAGIGKTRLVRAVTEAAPADAISLRARGYPLGATMAYGLWVEALEPLLEEMTVEEILDICGDYLPDLAGILHRVASVRGSVPADGSRPRVTEGLVRVLSDLAQRATLIVVLDDVHLGDPSSWEVVRHLARRAANRPILVLATLRPSEVICNEVAAQVQFELDQDGLLSRMDLPPLDAAALASLAVTTLGRQPAPELVGWLVERSGGSPLFALGLLNALQDEGADLDAPRLRRLPERLADRVRSRLGQFDAPEAEIVELVAVVGRPVSFAELQALTDRESSDLAARLDQLVTRRALVEDERGRDLTYEMSHALVRDAVYQDIGGARRRLLHRHAGRALAALGRISEAARHLARAAEVGDSEAVGTLLAAVRHAEGRDAYRESLELIAELVELLPEGDPRWAEVFDAIAWDADWVVDHRADAHGATAIRALRAIDGQFRDAAAEPGRRAQVKFRLATFLAWGAGDLRGAADTCAEAVRLFAEARDMTGELLATREAAFIAGLRGELHTMEAQARTVLRDAERLGQRFVVMQAWHAVAYATALRGAHADADAALQHAIDIAEADRKLYRATTALALRGLSASAAGEQSTARAAIARARALGPGFRDSALVYNEIHVHWFAGDMTGAVAAAREEVAWTPAGSTVRRAFGMAIGAIAAAEASLPAEAENLASRAERAVRATDWTIWLALASAARGMVERQTGRHGAGRPQLREAARILSGTRAYALLPYALDLVDSAYEEADEVAAAEAQDQLGAAAAETGLGVHHGLHAYASGYLALTRADREQAAQHARTAVAALESTGCRSLLARALHLLGRASQPRDDGLVALERSAELLAEGGATWRRERVLADLARLGGAGRRAAGAARGPTALSSREREVTALAAKGLTARQIASHLVLSTRTVETHLANARAKLGIASKAQIAQHAAAAGLENERPT